MLIVSFRNDGTGKPADKVGNYDVQVTVNGYKLLYTDKVKGHQRGDWRDLIIDWAEQLRLEQAKERVLIEQPG
jgi:hypothetical protein